jgi:hypothetical protein
MDEITVPSFRLALKKGKSVPGKPDLLIGKQIGTSLYTWNHIHELGRVKDQQQQQTEDSGLAIKVGSLLEPPSNWAQHHPMSAQQWLPTNTAPWCVQRTAWALW